MLQNETNCIYMYEYAIANLDSELQSPWKQRWHEFVGAADIPV